MNSGEIITSAMTKMQAACRTWNEALFAAQGLTAGAAWEMARSDIETPQQLALDQRDYENDDEKDD